MLAFAERLPPPAALFERVDLPRKRERCSCARGRICEKYYLVRDPRSMVAG
jgi:hypothetical protein